MKKLAQNISQSITMLFLVLLLNACNKTAENGITTFDCNTDQLQVVAENFVDSAVIYGQDPSMENCITYRTATEAYLAIIKDCQTVAIGAIPETEEILEDLDC